MPYVSVVESNRGATQFAFRYDGQDFLGQPFGGFPYNRDGNLYSAGVTQILFFFDRRLAATVGYSYEKEAPYTASGNDFAHHTHQGRIGLRFPGWWRTLVDVDYVYRYDDYTKPNSAADFRKTRLDNGNYLSTYVRRTIIDHLDAVLSYYVTLNGSNIGVYDYNRQVVSLELRYVF